MPTVDDWLQPEVKAQILRRRSTLHLFLDSFTPETTALVIIDMQKGYIDPAFGSIALPDAREIVLPINALSAALRRAGGCVVWVRSCYSTSSTSGLSHAVSAETLGVFRTLFSPTHEAYSLWPELVSARGDVEVTKETPMRRSTAAAERLMRR